MFMSMAMSPSRAVSIERLERLFRAPPSEFVSERNALVTALRKEGQPEAAAEVKELKKPGASAWAVNQLFWRHRELFEELLSAGDGYREAQKEALASGDDASLERAENERKRAVVNAQKRAKSILAESGLSASAIISSRIATTLEALASYGHANPSPYDGCASDDLKPPGFAALAALAPVTPRPRRHERPPAQDAVKPEPEPEPEPERAQQANDDAEQKRKREEEEQKRRELDAEIEKVAAELANANRALTQAEHEFAAAKKRAAELADVWEKLKGRRREMD